MPAPGWRGPFQKARRAGLDESRRLRRGILGSFISGATGSSGRDGVVALTSRPDRLQKAVDDLSCVVGASNSVPTIEGLLLLGAHHLQPLEYPRR